MLLRKTVVAVVALGTLALTLGAQEKKNWKDRAEYDLYTEIAKPDATPAARLQNLEKWKATYPQSEYADTRLKIYLVTYQQMNNHRAAFDMATEILKTEPNDQSSLQEILGYIRALMPQQANAPLSAQNKADLATAEKAAHYVLANADTVYAADKKPQGVADDVWAKTKPTMTNYGQFTLGWIAATEKDNAKAEAELTKTLQTDPTNSQAAYMLAGILLSQQKDHPEKMPFALFEYARSSGYDGPGALDAATRKTIDGFFMKAYTTYHGSPDGADKIKAAAKTAALPPSEFALKSTVDIAKDQEEARQKAMADNPMLGFWNQIKEGLTGDGSAMYWEALKDTAVPGGTNGVMKFKGKLVSATPETRPKELTIAVAGATADATLKLEEPLPGKMEPGGDISFSGVAKDFAKEPYMLTLEVSPDDVEGWTGKGTVPPRAPGAAKKGVPAKKKQ